MATINEKMTAIADAVRTKTGKTAKLTLDTMASDLNSIANRTSSDLTASGATVTVPAGNYKSQATKSVATVTRASTSISTSVDDTNDKITLTASNNQGTGYVTGSNQTATKTITLTASGATVTASDGSKSISKSVATATQATPSVSIDNSGLITATATQTAGYVSAGTKSGTKQLTVQAAKTVTPSTSEQTAVASGVYTTGAVKVAAIPTVTRANTTISVSADDTNDKLTITASNNQGTGYVTGANKTASTTISLTASGATVTASDGTNSVSKSVSTATRADTTISVSADDTNDKLTITASNNQGTGYVTGANKTATKTITLTASGSSVTASDGTNKVSKSVATATQATPSISINSSGKITASATQTAGYVSAGTKSGTKQLTTQAAKTVTPSTSEQTAVASGVYTTGAVKVAAIPSKYKDTSDANASAGLIVSGYTAYNSGGKITGTMPDRNIVGQNGVVGMSEQYPLAASNPTIEYLQYSVNTDGVGRICVRPPRGYYGGDDGGYSTSYVSVPAASFGTATPSQVLSGYSFTSASGLKKVGTLDITASALNFKVVGGTSAPSNPTENTIWINTNVTISKWSFFKTKPTWTMSDGWVYIVSEISTNNVATSFDAVVQNEMWVNPISAWQYVNGAWVQKDMQIYKNGAWIPYTVFLYKSGDQCSSTTGGWAGDNATDNGIYNVIDLRPYYLNGGYAGDSNGALRLSAAMKSGYGGYGAVSMATKNKIDLTNVNSIIVSATVYSSNSFTKVGVTSNDSIWNSSGYWDCAAYTNLVNGTTTLDVSSLSGSYHVVFGSHTGDDGASTSFAISEVVMK